MMLLRRSALRCLLPASRFAFREHFVPRRSFSIALENETPHTQAFVIRWVGIIGKDTAEATRYFDSVKEKETPSANTFHALLDVFSHNNQKENAIQLLDEMAALGRAPEIYNTFFFTFRSSLTDQEFQKVKEWALLDQKTLWGFTRPKTHALRLLKKYIHLPREELFGLLEENLVQDRKLEFSESESAAITKSLGEHLNEAIKEEFADGGQTEFSKWVFQKLKLDSKKDFSEQLENIKDKDFQSLIR